MAGKSKVLSKLIKGGALTGIAGGTGYAVFSGDDEEGSALASQPAAPPADAGAGGSTKQTSASMTQTQTSKREGSAPKVVAPKLPEAEQAKPLVQDPKDIALYQKAYTDMARTPEAKSLFKAQKKQLDDAIAEVMADYKVASKEAKDKGEKEATRARYASVAEGLANAALTIAAGMQGLRDGRAYAGSLQLTRSDWTSEIDKSIARALNERTALRADAGDAVKELDIQRRGLIEGDEKAASREERAGERLADATAKSAGDIRSTNARRAEAGISASNATAQRQAGLDMAAQQANAGNAVAFAPTSTTVTQTRTGEEEGTGGSAAAGVKKDRIVAFGKLSGAVTELQGKDTPVNRRNVVTQATLLGMSEVDKEALLKEATGAGMFNLAEPAKAQGILERYNPNLSLPGAGNAPGVAPGQARPVESASAPGIPVLDTQTGKTSSFPPVQALELLKNPRFQKGN